MINEYLFTKVNTPITVLGKKQPVSLENKNARTILHHKL